MEIMELAALGCCDIVNLRLIGPYNALDDWISQGPLVMVSDISNSTLIALYNADEEIGRWHLVLIQFRSYVLISI